VDITIVHVVIMNKSYLATLLLFTACCCCHWYHWL